MNKYRFLLLFALMLILFVGCGKRENSNTNTNSLGVFKESIRKTLVVVSSENIPKTHLVKLTIVDKNCNEEKFEIVDSLRQPSPLKLGDKVEVVIDYYDDKGVTRKWLNVLRITRK